MDAMGTVRWVAALAIVAGVSWAIPAWSQESKYSGTVAAVDRSAGTIVVEGMGPWQVKAGVTQVQRRSIRVTLSTEYVSVKRAPGPAPSGWVGDFVEGALSAGQVKPGDWVTVTLETDHGRATAVRVSVWEPTGG